MFSDGLMLTAPTPMKDVRRLTRTAYHEAGHAVVAAAIGDRLHYVSIRRDGGRLGVTMYRHPFTSIATAVQVFLAGHAAEEVLTGRLPRQLDVDLGVAPILAGRGDPMLADVEHSDGWLAVRALLEGGCARAEVRAEAERLYGAAQQSLIAVWSTVDAVAMALLRKGLLDAKGVDSVITGDIYSPVFPVQAAHCVP